MVTNVFTDVKTRFLPAWWTVANCARFWSIIAGVVIGGAIGAWLVYTPPWLSFNWISATYVPGSGVINVTGSYHARGSGLLGWGEGLLCTPEKNVRGNPITWRQEVKGSPEGPLAQYAPSPAPPTLLAGEHIFYQEIGLTQGIDPDGWEVAVLVTCDNPGLDLGPVRSSSVKVQFVNAALNP